MSLGSSVRRLFGPLEAPVTDLYRSFFVNLELQVRQVRDWVPGARNILEVGCGEGAVCERLATEFPTARVTGIDITPRVGRLFRTSTRVSSATSPGFWSPTEPCLSRTGSPFRTLVTGSVRSATAC